MIVTVIDKMNDKLDSLDNTKLTLQRKAHKKLQKINYV